MSGRKPTSTPPSLAEDEGEYISSEDEDFDPSAAADDDGNVSSDESDDSPNVAVLTAKPGRKKPKGRKTKNDAAGDLGFENSGDEATMHQAKGQGRKRRTLDEDSGGEGGFVKTRSMRAAV